MSPRTSAQYKRMREDRSSLIMDAALEQFARRGFHATTIHHIARCAGISNGLTYNYFSSKEALLEAIIRKYLDEVYSFLDINRDDRLSVEEFEFFIRRSSLLLKEKRYFWRLLLQLLMQDDARSVLLNALHEPSGRDGGQDPARVSVPWKILRLFARYFSERSVARGDGSDPGVEMKLFFITMSGYALDAIFLERENEMNDAGILDRIIGLYK